MPTIPEDVLIVAKRLAVRHGLDAVTMDSLAEESGLSRTTLYRRTGGREAVVDALAQAGVAVGDRTETRARILNAAREVFSRNGFTAGTAEEIASVAKVSLMTVYRHFGDKEGLAAAVLQELAPRRVLREAKPTGDLRHDLTAMVEGILTGLRDETPLVRWMLIEALQEGELLPRVRALNPTRSLSAVVRLLAQHLREGDPQQLARAFVGMVMAFGVIGPIFHKEPFPDPAATARLVTDVFLRGALAPGSRS